MKRHSRLTAAIVAALSFAATSAQATRLSPEDCRAKTRPCACGDAPFVEIFWKNQVKSREAWSTVFDTIGTPSGPTTTEQAKDAHDRLFSGDPRVITQYKTCPSYDPNADLTQIAGAPGPGEVWVDQCACEAFCSDVIEATIAHEQTHPPTIILGVANYSIDMAMCAAGVHVQSICDQIEPTILAGSELISYSVGNHLLESSLENLRKLPSTSKPNELCTWQPMASTTTVAPPREGAPKNAWARLVNLADRFWNGVSS